MNYRIFLAAMAMIWMGCGGNEPQDGKEGNLADEEYILKIDGDTASYSSQLHYKTDKTDAGIEAEDVTKIVFSFPRFELAVQPHVRDSINRAIENLLLLNDAGALSYTSLEERMSDFIAQYEEDKAMSEGLGWGSENKWNCEVRVEVLANTPRLISLRFSERNFTGGAHDNQRVQYLNFNAKTGRVLQIADLVSVAPEKLEPIAEKFFRKKANIPDNLPITETQYEFLSGHFELPEAVGITRKTLIFHYNAYELGSQAEFTFEVPLKAVAPYLNKELMY